MLRSLLASSTLRQCASTASMPLSAARVGLAARAHLIGSAVSMFSISVRHMGYDTRFTGHISIEPKLNADEISYLNSLARTCRMARMKGPLYAPADAKDLGQIREPDVADFDHPNAEQPSRWCQWYPSADGERLRADKYLTQKFDNSVEWMEYIIQNLLAPSAKRYLDKHKDEDPRLASFTCNHVLNGEIEAQGEHPTDRWSLIVVGNVVSDVNRAAKGQVNVVMLERRQLRARQMELGRQIQFDKQRAALSILPRVSKLRQGTSRPRLTKEQKQEKERNKMIEKMAQELKDKHYFG